MTDKKDKEHGMGLECPACGCFDSRVYYVRRRPVHVDGKQVGGIMRSRTCNACGCRFSTKEVTS